MMKIIPLSAFSDNYIWVIHSSDSNTVAVVDPGDATPVIDYLEQHNLSLETILITHHHNDHIGGVQTLKNRYQCRVFAPKRDNQSFSDQDLVEGDEVSILNDEYQFSVIEVPGHTMGHIAFYGHGCLFCGDTLFKAGCGRMFEGTPPVFLESLQKLAALPAETKVYCAHEYTLTNLKFALSVEPDNPAIHKEIEYSQRLREKNKPTLPSTIGEELSFNPFLRCDQDALQQTASQASETKTFSDPVRTFATIRQLKDNF
ncbi:hydroxyacylglutathione hydrolase [Kangiella marina]|uniref:Hydroxyacylglutathione hydrolase n=1 Tax=Kangiella marina TaxID=1079178 RepID=A0ABP8IEI1_9GAMM